MRRSRLRANSGCKVIIHIQNRGYGGNQKTCYIEALREGADIVVMLHPDYQYDSTCIPELIAPIAAGEADMMIGSRLLGGGTLAGGMPIWKYVSNRFLTAVENHGAWASISPKCTAASGRTAGGCSRPSPSCSTPTTSSSTPR